MTSFPGEGAPLQSGVSAQHQASRQGQNMGAGERPARTAASTRHESLLQEFAAELTPTPEELAEAFGPAGKDESAPSPRHAARQEQGAGNNFDMIMRIPVSVQVVLGSATMSVSGLVKLGRGAVIPLDRRVGEPVDVMVNGRLVARGEVVVMDESSSRFGISLTEVVTGPGSARDA